MSSRIVVKNIPSWITEDKLRSVFLQKGHVTDCSIKYNSSGKSRRFAFVGFSEITEAEEAVQYFNNTCIGSSKIRVEPCKDLVDKTDSLTNYPQIKKTSGFSLPETLGSDEKFKEFIQLHERTDKNWRNDVIQSHSSDSINDVGDNGKDSFGKINSVNITSKEEIINDTYVSMVKLRNLPYNVSKDQLKQFFCGLDIKKIVLSSKKRKPGENSSGYVEFVSQKSMEQALRRNKGFLGGKKVIVMRVVRAPANFTNNSESQKPQKSFQHEKKRSLVDLSDSGRLFVRNLSYICKEENIQELFMKYGELSEVYVPLEKSTKQNKGFAFISYLLPEHAVRALNELDGTTFQGRMLHILPADSKPDEEKYQSEKETFGSSFKNEKEAALRNSANSSHNWNALFIGANAVIDSVSSEYGSEKKHLFDQSGAAVRMAIGETELVLKNKKFLEDNGVRLEAFGKTVVKRSKTAILIKNLPAQTRQDELQSMFEKFGCIARLVLPPSGVSALLEYSDANEAKLAFRSLAYRRFKNMPLYLEWAPVDVFSSDAPLLKDQIAKKQAEAEAWAIIDSPLVGNPQETGTISISSESTTLFVKNLNFKTTEKELNDLFESRFLDKVSKAVIAKNKGTRGGVTSLGYGFVEFKDASTAQEALKKMQHSELDGHKVELKLSNSRSEKSKGHSSQMSSKEISSDQKPSTRILVRNIPFEANTKDVQELFAVFGNLRFVRLPKKAVVLAVGTVSGRSGGGRAAQLHRGFGFVDFHSIEDAKRAFEALRHSTHLYGRRLVLEWAKTEEADLIEELRSKAAERAVAAAAAASGAVHAGAAKRLRKVDLATSVEQMTKKSQKSDVTED